MTLFFLYKSTNIWLHIHISSWMGLEGRELRPTAPRNMYRPWSDRLDTFPVLDWTQKDRSSRFLSCKNSCSVLIQHFPHTLASFVSFYPFASIAVRLGRLRPSSMPFASRLIVLPPPSPTHTSIAPLDLSHCLLTKSSDDSSALQHWNFSPFHQQNMAAWTPNKAY